MGEGNTDIERPLECGDRVKSIFRDRFGTVIRVQGGLVSTQWENGFTSTERREEIQLVLSALVGESQPQGELDDLPSDTDSGQLMPKLERLEQDVDPSGKEPPKPSETRVRFLLSWFGSEVEGSITSVVIDWEYKGRTGQSQVPMNQVVLIFLDKES